MKNIVNRALVAKKKQFQSKSVPRGTRTIWRYLGALFLLFTFAIGNVWGVDVTIAQPANPSSSSNNISYGLFIVSHNNGATYSSGAIKAANNGDEVTITLTTTKSDMYIKSVEFESPSSGSITSDDGTKSGNVFTITGNKNSVAIKLKSNSGAKGSVKFKQAVINSGANDFEAITFNSYNSSSKAFTFTSSSATSALTSITQSTAKSYTVSSNVFSGWANQGDVVFTSTRKIQYIALLLTDAKNYSTFKENNNSGAALTNHVWTGNSNAVTIYNGTGGGRSIKNVYVVFAPATYTLAWNLDGGSVDVAGTAAGSYTAGTTITAPTVSKSGFAFNGWDPAVPATMPAANSEYTATWTANTHSLVWNIPGDATITNQETYTHGTVAYGTAIVAPTLSREDYDFLGWDATPAATMPDNDLEYTATWQPAAAKHNITYAGYGSADMSGYPTQYSEGIGIASFAPLADTEDQHFLGWDPASIAASATTDQTITATWEAKKVVTFNTGLGSAIAAVKVVSGEAVAAPTAPTRLNWTFQKWQKEGVDYDFATPVTEDITLDAVWSRDEISGTPTDIVLVSTSAAIGSTSPLTDVYYGNAEWTYTGNAKISTGGAMFGTPNAKKWVGFTLPNGYTATVTANSTNSNERHCVLVTEADRAGNAGDATFLLDITTNSSTTTATSSSFGAGSYALGSTSGGIDINSVVVHVSEAPIMVTFKTGEATYAAISATSGEELGNLFLNGELPSGLVVPGYTFNGWADVTKATVISASMTVQANLTPVTYNVTLNKGLYGSTNGAATVGLGDEALTISSAATAPAGYTLLGYFTAADGETKVAEADGSFVDETIAGYIASGKWNNAGDATLYAHWQDNSAVAKIGETYYESLPEAVEDATDGQTVYLLKNVAAGAGVMIAKADAKQITIDFGGYTYTANSPAVGSAGTQNQAFHFEKGCDITLKNGTITSEGSEIKMLIQNYGDLTLEDITLDGKGLEGDHRYVMSNNCGDVVIGDGTTITAKDGDVAFDVCATNYYPEGVTVTVKDGATVNGIVEYDVWGTKPADNKAELAIEGGTLNITWNVESALAEDAKSNLNVSGGVFNAAVPEDYCAEGYIPSAEIAPGKYGVIATAKSVDFTDSDVQTLGVGTAMSTYNYTLASTSGVSFDDANAYDTGLKMKNSTTNTLSFIVEPGKLVTIITGNIAGMTYSVNGGAADALNGGTDKDHLGYTYLYNDAVQNIVLAETSETYNIIREINIHSPYEVSYDPHGADPISAQFATPSVILPTPANGTGVFKGWYDAETEGNKIGNAGDSYTPTATVTLHAQWETVSSDNTLSALEVDGVALADFDPNKHIYNIVCEYGHTPQITLATATAEAQGATVAISNTPVDGDGYKYIQANVTPASGTPIGYNQVRYTNKPKQGATIFKAELTAANDADYSGLYADEANSQIALAVDADNNNEYKFSGTSNFIKMAIADATFAEGDMLKMTYSTNPQQGELAIYDGTTKVQGTPYTNNILTFSDAVGDDKSTLFIRRTSDNKFNAWVAAVEVQRYMDPFIASFKIGEAVGSINESAKTIAIEVPFTTDVTSLTPEIEAYANGGATLDKTGAQDFSNPVTYKVSSAYAEDGNVTYTVTVTKAEASHDATLSDIKLNGVSLAGFAPATLTYNVELEKGTSVYPTVTYTAAAGATVAPNSETFPGAYNLVVTAEDGATENTYTINFTVSTKDKVVIFDGSTMDAIATSPDVTTGLSWLKTGDMSVESKTAPAAAAKAYTNAIQIGSTGSSKNFKVVVPNKYAAQFFLAHNSNGDAERTVYIDTEYGQAPKDGIYNVANTKSDIAEGKSSTVGAGTYYINVSGGTVNIYEISVYLDRVSETPAISAQPTNLAVCAISTDALSVTASVEAGTLSYQWYKVVDEGDDEAVGTNSNEYVPAAVGQYYVVVTNTEGTYTPSSKKSDVVTVSLKPATEITSAPSNQRGAVDAVVTLSVEATAATNYAWYTCDENGNNAVAVEGASGATKTSIQVTIIEDMRQYYKVVVTGECGTDEAIALVEEWSEVAQANVTGYQKWDWNVTTNAAAWAGVANIQLTGADKTTDFIMANTASTMPNNAAFRSDMLITNGEYPARPTQDGGVFQGYAVKFHTTVPGKVTVVYRGTGSSVKVNLKINDWTPGETSDWKTKNVVVPAGDVVITDINDEVLRIRSIEFDPALNPEDAEASTLGGYTRSVTEGRYGTICLPNGGVMVGAELFEIAYYGQTSHKIFLDNIPSGEMEAGVPYIFLPKESTTQLAVFYTDEVNASAGSHNGLIGFIGDAADEYFYIPAGAGNYILQNNLYREVLAGAQARILSNRAYIKLSEINPTEPALAPGRRRVAMGVQSEQVATGCENLNVSDKPVKMIINGQLFILCGEKMYDAKGQLVK